MEHIYHVQHEVVSYYKHIPIVPEYVAIDEKLLFDMTESQYIENLSYFTELMRSIYKDMEVRPIEYGLLTIDINRINENKADGNLAKASWRAVKRLGDVIAVIGKLGEVDGDKLRLSVTTFKDSLKKIDKLSLILNRFIDFGFSITNYNGKGFNKGIETFYISYPKKPLLMRIIKAYAISEPYHNDDPHEFYYFDYKRLANREKLHAHCVSNDLAALINEENGKLLIEINKCFVDELWFLPHYKDDSIEYYYKKKRVARFMIDFHNLDVVLILKLKDMDKYIDQIEKLPDNLQKYFLNGNCRYCGFQNSTAEHCKFRISWTLNSRKYNACNFTVFNFYNPKRADAEYFINLMKFEYKIQPKSINLLHITEIRPLSAKHLPDYAGVIRKSFATVAKDFGLTEENCPGHTSFITDERLVSKFKNGYYPFGLCICDKIIGFASLTDMGDGTYEMNDVSVLPDYRHYGYGKKLLDFCKAKVKELGSRKITIGIVEENTVLKDWYAANGFVHTGTKKFDHLPFTVGFMEWSAV